MADLKNCFSPLHTEEVKEMFEKIITSNRGFNADDKKLDDRLPMEAIVVCFDRSASMMDKCFSRDKHALNRLEVIKECWHAFINRSTAYDFPNEIGLVVFDSEVDKTCDITCSYEQFLRKVEEIETGGCTALRDAIEEASKMLIKWKNNKAEKQRRTDSKLRIIALTDGDDNYSSIDELDVVKLLNQNDIILDAISIGKHNKSLHAMAKSTGGYIFVPSKLIDTIRIFELESFLSITKRKEIINDDKIGMPYSSQFQQLKLTKPDICTFNIVPDGKAEPNLLKQFNTKTLENIVNKVGFDTNSNTTISKKQRYRRVMREMTAILKQPHPCYDVYPCENDLYFWKVILECPVENHSSAYEGGVWLLYVSFPDDYPSKAPIMRFVTPIKHVNVNCYGRICHSIFTTNYTRDVTIKDIFSNAYGLMLHPDFDNPLDNVLRTEYSDDKQSFFLSVEAHTDKHAKKPNAKSRQQWMKQLSGQIVKSAPSLSKISPSSQTNLPKQISAIVMYAGQKKRVTLKNSPENNVYEYKMDILRSKLMRKFASKGLKQSNFYLKTSKGYVVKNDYDIVEHLSAHTDKYWEIILM